MVNSENLACSHAEPTIRISCRLSVMFGVRSHGGVVSGLSLEPEPLNRSKRVKLSLFRIDTSMARAFVRRMNVCEFVCVYVICECMNGMIDCGKEWVMSNVGNAKCMMDRDKIPGRRAPTDISDTSTLARGWFYVIQKPRMIGNVDVIDEWQIRDWEMIYLGISRYIRETNQSFRMPWLLIKWLQRWFLAIYNCHDINGIGMIRWMNDFMNDTGQFYILSPSSHLLSDFVIISYFFDYLKFFFVQIFI